MFAELNKKRNKKECKSIHRKQIYGYQRGKGRGGINWEFELTDTPDCIENKQQGPTI